MWCGATLSLCVCHTHDPCAFVEFVCHTHELRACRDCSPNERGLIMSKILELGLVIVGFFLLSALFALVCAPLGNSALQVAASALRDFCASFTQFVWILALVCIALAIFYLAFLILTSKDNKEQSSEARASEAKISEAKIASSAPAESKIATSKESTLNLTRPN